MSPFFYGSNFYILVNLPLDFFTNICYINNISNKRVINFCFIVHRRGSYQRLEDGCKGVVPRLGSRNTLSHIALPSGYRLPGFRMVSAARGWRCNLVLPIIAYFFQRLTARVVGLFLSLINTCVR